MGIRQEAASDLLSGARLSLKGTVARVFPCRLPTAYCLLKTMDPRDRLVVAVDVSKRDDILLSSMSSADRWRVQSGLQAFIANGPEIVREIVSSGEGGSSI